MRTAIADGALREGPSSKSKGTLPGAAYDQVSAESGASTATHQPAVRGHSADAPADAIGTAAQTEFISFAIGDEQYGIDIMAVREIREWADVTHLPKQPDYVRGVLNLRGVIVPIIDLRCRSARDSPKRRPCTS